MGKITGVVVTYNTYGLFKAMYESLREWLPELPLVVVDGSDRGNACYGYVKGVNGGLNTCYQLERNIGHGLGMHYGIEHTASDAYLLMDSDIVLTGNPLAQMEALLTDGVYGVGELYHIGMDGLHRNPVCNLPYLRPYFMLLSRTQYYQHHRFIHHGSPCVKAMRQIFEAGQSAEKLKVFDLGAYVQHGWGGTRKENVKSGKAEIPNLWEK
jgi:hypothetical protein